MNQLTKIFEGQELRIVGSEEDPYFLLNDVCKILNLAPRVVRQRLTDDVCSTYPIIDALGRTQQATFVNEDGLYDVVLESRKTEAKKFRRWITSEVIPSIRKHGGYLTPEKVEQVLSDPDTIIRLATDLKQERLKRQRAEWVIEQQKPKVLFADSVKASQTSILIRELAVILKQNGIDTGEKRLYEWLRENGYLVKRLGTDRNTPTQRSMDLGLFEIKETPINHNSGMITVSKTTKVTGKGQVYFINKFLNLKVVV